MYSLHTIRELIDFGGITFSNGLVLSPQDKLEEVRASAVLKTFLQSPYESPETSENEEDEGEENA